MCILRAEALENTYSEKREDLLMKYTTYSDLIAPWSMKRGFARPPREAARISDNTISEQDL
jgi:hypothetical protein